MQEACQYIGMSMTYTLFEYVKENSSSLMTNQPENIEAVRSTSDICDSLKNTVINGM